MSLFADTQRSIPLTEQLYQAAREATACYIDDNMTERVTVYVTGEFFLFQETSPPQLQLGQSINFLCKSHYT